LERDTTRPDPKGHGCSSASLFDAVVAQEQRRRSTPSPLPAVITPGLHNYRYPSVQNDQSEAARPTSHRFPGLYVDTPDHVPDPERPFCNVFHEGPQQFDHPLTRAAYLKLRSELDDFAVPDPGPRGNDTDEDEFRCAAFQRACEQVFFFFQQQQRNRTSYAP
jgi:hypothetical protein